MYCPPLLQVARPEAERRAALRRLGVLAAERAGHHAGAAGAEEVIDGVEREQHRRDQRDSGILDRVVQQTDEPRVGEAVQQRDKDGRDRGHGERQHGLRHGHRLEQGGLIGLVGAFHDGDSFLVNCAHKTSCVSTAPRKCVNAGA